MLMSWRTNDIKDDDVISYFAFYKDLIPPFIGFNNLVIAKFVIRKHILRSLLHFFSGGACNYLQCENQCWKRAATHISILFQFWDKIIARILWAMFLRFDQTKGSFERQRPRLSGMDAMIAKESLINIEVIFTFGQLTWNTCYHFRGHNFILCIL